MDEKYKILIKSGVAAGLTGLGAAILTFRTKESIKIFNRTLTKVMKSEATADILKRISKM